jgi:aspartyl/asparaginyl beta-hydroxylase (cupin superfamily)
MAAPAINLPEITAAGYAALQRGDLQAARLQFDQVIAAGGADAAVWLGLARVHRALRQPGEADRALDRALDLDAYYFPALLAKGDLFKERGDGRAASAYFSAAIKAAGRYPSLPDEWRSELRRAASLSQEHRREFEAHLLSSLTRAGFDPSADSRFAHAVELLLGKREVFSQQPKFFYYPELPQIQFFDRQLFPWVHELESEFAAICGEARAVLEADTDFVPYVQREGNRPVFNERGLLNNSDWGAFFLIKDGVPVEANAARCPRTFAAVSKIPLSRIDKRTPSVLFSLLRPGARIPPHHGFMNARLIAHLPLIVPADCGLRVGNETRRWREGETVFFDDSIEHEAWNSSTEPRIVLIFDVWRPELSARERELIAATLTAVDGFGGPRRPWTE